jgi:epoxyqueuosine reductase
MPPVTPASVKARAAELGFDLCGIASAERHPRLLRLAEWIADGRAGDMTYLARSLDERLDPARVLASARTVVSVASVYNTSAPEPEQRPPGDAVVARYARGDDYHIVMGDRLRRLVQWMADEAGPGFEAFSSVDSGPIQERVFAEQAGLGWIGKNTCVINPRLGSWLLLGEVLTNQPIAIDQPAVDQCGTCTRCLDACPTGALVAPYVLDATRCLSYLTIEQRGPVDPRLRAEIGARIFGCDICQDVCPWNRRAAVTSDPSWQARPMLSGGRLLELCALPDAEWSRLLKGSAMRRAGLHRVRRSLAYAAAHLAAADRERALDLLSQQPSAGYDQVADAIAWARGARAMAQPPDGAMTPNAC